MEEKTVKVSVIIPVYNTEMYLYQNIKSVLNQSLREIEVIAVDDGSTDGSFALLKEIEKMDSRLKVYQQKNLYAGAARNFGMSVAKGEFLVFLDSDDFFEKNMLELMYQQCQEDDAQVCVCNGRIYDENTKEYRQVDYFLKKNDLPKVRPFSRKDMPDKIFNFTTAAPWTKMFRASFIEEQQLQFQEIRRANDMYFCFTALAAAERITTVDFPLVNYRSGHFSSLQATKDDTPLDFYVAMKALKKELERRKIFAEVEKSFVNFCLGGCLHNLNTAKTGAGYSKIYMALKNEIFEELKITGHSSGYFYMKDYYKQMESILADKPEVNVFDRMKCLERQLKSYESGLVPEKQIPSDNTYEGDPKVSVIIPAYNVQVFLRECLDSVIGQTLSNIQIICVNDGSTDDSLEIMKEYAEKDSRVFIIDKENGGLSSARNAGLNAAKGEYILFLDSDDYIAEETLKTLYDYADYFDLDELFYNAEVFYDTDELEQEHESYSGYYVRKGQYPNTEIGRNLFVKFQQNGDFKPSACLQILKRSFLEEHKIRFYEGILHEDNLFTMQCLSLAKRTRLLDQPFYKRRVRGGSIMTDAKGFRNAYGKFVTVVEMLNFIEKEDLYKYTGFYAALMKQLSILCDSASMDVNSIDNTSVIDYINQMKQEDRSLYFLFVYQLKEIRWRMRRAAEADVVQEKKDLKIQLQIAQGKNSRLSEEAADSKSTCKKYEMEVQKIKKELAEMQSSYKKKSQECQKLERRNQQIAQALTDTQNSLTFRLGSFFTAVPKRIRDFFK